MDADVVVIGGGFAGVVAARDLRQAGRRVILLEARNRLGGRTWFRTMPGTDLRVEYGGAWFWSEGHPALAAEIDRYGLAVNELPPRATVSWINRAGRVDGPGALSVLHAAMATADQVLAPTLERIAEAERTSRRASLMDLDVPFAGWLRSVGLGDEAEDFMLAFSASMGGGDPAEQSALAILADAVHTGYRFEEAFTDVGQSLVEGTKSLVDAIASDAGADLRLRSVARRIRHDADGAEVDLDGGGTVSAHAAIVALPLNVWRDVAFDPPLSERKQRIAATGHAGTSKKVLAVASGVPGDFEGVGWPATIQAMIGEREAPGGRLVIGFCGVGGIDPTDVSAVEKAVKEYLPDSEVLASGGHDWVSDPFSRGAWLAPRPGWGATSDEPLTAPEGRVAFAGSDIAPKGAGWIEGAVVTGRSAASEALTILDR